MGTLIAWNENDFYHDMYKAGRPDASWNGFELAAKAYTRYNCVDKILCVMVRAQPGNIIQASLENSWLKDYSKNPSTPNGSNKYDEVSHGTLFFKESDQTIGWEACYHVPFQSVRPSIEIHANYGQVGGGTGDTASTGKDSNNALIPIDLTCAPSNTQEFVVDTSIPDNEFSGETDGENSDIGGQDSKLWEEAGTLAEWDVEADFFQALQKADGTDGNAKAYIQYNCNAGILCVMVRAKEGFLIDAADSTAFMKYYSPSTSGIYPMIDPDTRFIGKDGLIIGWECCYQVSPSELTNEVVFYTNIGQQGNNPDEPISGSKRTLGLECSESTTDDSSTTGTGGNSDTDSESTTDDSSTTGTGGNTDSESATDDSSTTGTGGITDPDSESTTDDSSTTGTGGITDPDSESTTNDSSTTGTGGNSDTDSESATDDSSTTGTGGITDPDSESTTDDSSTTGTGGNSDTDSESTTDDSSTTGTGGNSDTDSESTTDDSSKTDADDNTDPDSKVDEGVEDTEASTVIDASDDLFESFAPYDEENFPFNADKCDTSCDSVSSGNWIFQECENGDVPVCMLSSENGASTTCVDSASWERDLCGDHACGPCTGMFTLSPRSLQMGALGNGSIVADGKTDDWNQDDFHADMYRQGEPSTSFKGHQVGAKLYTRVDCGNPQRLCVLVLAESGFHIAPRLQETWIKDYSATSLGNNRMLEPLSPGIVFVTKDKVTIGWEGCFKIPNDAISGRKSIEVHVNYGPLNAKASETGSTGKESNNALISLDFCDAPKPDETITNTNGDANNEVGDEDEGDANGEANTGGGDDDDGSTGGEANTGGGNDEDGNTGVTDEDEGNADGEANTGGGNDEGGNTGVTDEDKGNADGEANTGGGNDEDGNTGDTDEDEGNADGEANTGGGNDEDGNTGVTDEDEGNADGEANTGGGNDEDGNTGVTDEDEGNADGEANTGGDDGEIGNPDGDDKIVDDYSSDPCDYSCNVSSSGNEEVELCEGGKVPVCHYESALSASTVCIDPTTWKDSCQNDICGPCTGFLTLTPRNARIEPDGNIDDWSVDDHLADFEMFRQGNPDDSLKRFQVGAKAYTRLDCDEDPQRLCVLVLAEPGFNIAASEADSWIKDYEADLKGDKLEVLPPGIVFVKMGSATIGWEGCFKIPENSESGRNSIEIHANYGTWGSTGETASTGKASNKALVSLDFCDVEEPEEETTDDTKGDEDDANIGGEGNAGGDDEDDANIGGEGNAGGDDEDDATISGEGNAGGDDEDDADIGGEGNAGGDDEDDATIGGEGNAGGDDEGDANTGGQGNAGGDDEDANTDGEGNTKTADAPESGGGYGDPHVKTWLGHVYDFHGECDLVLAHSKTFLNGVGFDLHIRTKMRRNWSFIETAALRIGGDVFQVGRRGIHFENSHTGPRLIKSHTMVQTVGGFPIHYTYLDDKRHKFEVDLGERGTVVFKVYNEFLAVSILNAREEDFGDAVGLMGHFGSGKLLNRQGEECRDTNEFGMDWQVRDTEPQLFHTVEGPQYPQRCNMPPPGTAAARRRLSESMVSFDEAAKACEGWGEEGKESCMFDVLETGDLSLAAHPEL